MIKRKRGKLQLRIESYLEVRTKVAGVTRDNRQAIIKKHVRTGTAIIPVLEPDNPHDPNAVALYVKTKGLFKKRLQIGYLNRAQAEEVSRYMRAGAKPDITVLNVTGGTRKKKTRGVNIEIQIPVG